MGEQVDWQKVGRIYKPDSAIEHIIQSEVSRLNKALDLNLEAQSHEMEEKMKAKKK